MFLQLQTIQIPTQTEKVLDFQVQGVLRVKIMLYGLF